jgi:hypothetical protein
MLLYCNARLQLAEEAEGDGVVAEVEEGMDGEDAVMLQGVCVCACVCACVRVCICVCVHICMFVFTALA